MATLCLINFPEFSESKEFLKIGRTEVCVWGGAKGRTTKLSLSVCTYIIWLIFVEQKSRFCKRIKYFLGPLGPLVSALYDTHSISDIIKISNLTAPLVLAWEEYFGYMQAKIGAVHSLADLLDFAFLFATD